MFRKAPHVCALMWLVLGVGALDPSARALTCPQGTRAQGAHCVLESDLVLAESLELQSFTTLNCRGHRILPANTGSGTTPETYIPSIPPVAIAVTGERAVDVRNCIIGEDAARFDFGIIAINSKHAARLGHRIHDNEIHAHDSGITFLRVDDAQVNDNIITWTNGFGMSFARDSDRNRINGNTLSSIGAPPATIRLVPGGPFRNLVDDGIMLGDLHLQPLYNVVIGGQLYQFPNSEDGQYAGHEDNVIDNNHLSLPGSSTGKSHTGIKVVTNAMRSHLIGNTITEAGIGIRLAGLMREQPVPRAGRCLTSDGRETARFCQTHADCFIAEIDAEPIGSCPLLVTDVRDLRARDTLVEDNTLVGPFNSTTLTPGGGSGTAMRAAIFGGQGTVDGIIRDNRIFGTGIEPGITIAGNMLETGEVTGNIVQGASLGIMLQQGGATSFGARVFLNDFTGSTTRAIGILGSYALPTELSWHGVGNYWGHATPPCFRSTDSPNPALIHDSHPFCEPVAASLTPTSR